MSFRPGLSVTIAGRQLEQKAAHSVTQDVGDHAEILHERLGPFELLDVSDQLADFYRVNELLPAGQAAP